MLETNFYEPRLGHWETCCRIKITFAERVNMKRGKKSYPKENINLNKFSEEKNFSMKELVHFVRNYLAPH